MEEFNDFEAILAIKASDWPIAMKAIPYIKKNLKPSIKFIKLIEGLNLRMKLLKNSLRRKDSYNNFRNFIYLLISES